MKKNLKILLLILITFFCINITYAENKCEIKDFKFNHIFEKNKDLDFIYLFEGVLDYLKIAPQIDVKNKTNFEQNNKIFKNTYLYYMFNSYFYFLNCDFNKSIDNYLSGISYPSFDKNDRVLTDIQYLDLSIYGSFSYFLSGNFDKSIEILEKVLNRLNYIMEYEKLSYFQQVLGYNRDKFSDYLNITESLIDYINKIKNLKTSDEYSGEQYYLDKLNIIEAGKNQNFGCIEYLSNGECKTKFSGKENIVVAVIDDGINLNHLDITNKIWTNKKEIPGNKMDDDKNGFVDDFNGWNFYYNDNNTLPMGEHGTAVAGIIGAEANNGIGMAGIIPNAKIMSLGVFSETGTTKTEDVLKAINYAIDNNADIINLSLAGTQFIFSQEYNEIFKKAYEKNIPIIVSAGNGDTLSSGEIGVNTTINKLSPVCNDFGNKKMVIGVGSLQENGEKSKWSNYGDCVDFRAFGENIFSLSLLDEESEYGKDYNKFYGTSFSAPTLAGIIGLGINKVGNIKPDLIFDALEKSLKGNIINTNLFIDNLISLSNEEVKKQEEIKKQESMKKLQEKINQKNEERKKKLEEKKQEKNIKKEIVPKENNYNKIIDFIKNKWLEIIAILFIFLLGIIAFIQNRKNNF